MSQERDHSSLSVPPSIQNHKQGVLNAAVVLVLYGDYQDSQSADIYRLIKAIQRQFSVSLGENHLCLIFRHFLPRQIYAQAQHAVEASEAVDVQKTIALAP